MGKDLEFEIGIQIAQRIQLEHGSFTSDTNCYKLKGLVLPNKSQDGI